MRDYYEEEGRVSVRDYCEEEGGGLSVRDYCEEEGRAFCEGLL